MTLPSWSSERRTLTNGVVIMATQVPTARFAYVVAMVRGGPVYERDHEWGLSHLLEHMVFRGANQHRTVRDVILAADACGADIAAATYRDRIMFDSRADEASLGSVCELLADMMTTPRFQGFAVEKEVVLAEISDLYDEHGQDVDLDNAVFRHHFANSRLARSIEGTPELIAGYRLADLKHFHRRLFSGSNLVVSVCSAQPTSRVLKKVAAAFASLPPGEAPPWGAPASVAPMRPMHVLKTSDGQTAVRLSFALPGRRHADAFALGMVHRLLDDGPAARLHDRIIDRRGLAYSAWGAIDLYEDNGLFELAADVPHDRVGAVVDAFSREVRSLWRPAPAAELQRTVARAARELGDAWHDETHIAESGARSMLTGVDHNPRRQLAKIRTATPAMVASAARRWLRHPKLLLVGMPPRAEVAAAKASWTALLAASAA